MGGGNLVPFKTPSILHVWYNPCMFGIILVNGGHAKWAMLCSWGLGFRAWGVGFRVAVLAQSIKRGVALNSLFCGPRGLLETTHITLGV